VQEAPGAPCDQPCATCQRGSAPATRVAVAGGAALPGGAGGGRRLVARGWGCTRGSGAAVKPAACWRQRAAAARLRRFQGASGVNIHSNARLKEGILTGLGGRWLRRWRPTRVWRRRRRSQGWARPRRPCGARAMAALRACWPRTRPTRRCRRATPCWSTCGAQQRAAAAAASVSSPFHLSKAWGASGAVLVHAAAPRRGPGKSACICRSVGPHLPCTCLQACLLPCWRDSSEAPCTEAAPQGASPSPGAAARRPPRARGRPEVARARDGAPELRFGARGRGAAVPVQPLPAGLARRVRDARRLEYDVAAAVVAGLAKVG